MGFLSGLFGGGGDAPTLDVKGSVKKQRKENKQIVRRNTKRNRLNETGPNSSLKFKYDKNGNPTGVKKSLTGTAGAFDTSAGNAVGQYDQGLQALRDNPLQIDKAVQDRVYGMLTDRLPQEEMQQQDRLQSRLAAMGFDPAKSAAAQNSFRDQQRGFDDRRNQFALQAQGQAYNQALTDRGDQYKQLGALAPHMNYAAGAAQLGNAPINYAGVNEQGIDHMGAAQAQYNADMQGYQNEQQQKADMWSGISSGILGIAGMPLTGGASLGGTGLMSLGNSIFGK